MKEYIFLSICLASNAKDIISVSHKSVFIFCFNAKYRDFILNGFDKYHKLVTFSFIAWITSCCLSDLSKSFVEWRDLACSS